MNSPESRFAQLFLEIHGGLPRQGPGDAQSTLRALQLCSDLPATPSTVDFGCGPGAQTLVLAEHVPGPILALDNCEPFLEQLRERLRQANLTDRVQVLNRDMQAPGLPPRDYDLIWCEGAAYILGVQKALKEWPELMRSGGYLAFTELVWLDENPPAEIAQFFRQHYPPMTQVVRIKQWIRSNDLQLVGDFTLPDQAWWEEYYDPLEANIARFEQQYAHDPEALAVMAASRQEIELRRQYHRAYGYHFFVARTCA